MKALALALTGAALSVAVSVTLPAAADTAAPPTVVVVVPGGPPAAPPPPSYPPGTYVAPGAYPAPPPPAYPPPQYYAPPGPYYAPPAAYPIGPVMERRSTGAMVGGILGVTGGGIMLLSAVFVLTFADTACIDGINGSGACGSQTGTVVGLTVAGVVAMAAGIPLIVWGAKKVPVGMASTGGSTALPSPLPAWAGAPGGAGWRWRF